MSVAPLSHAASLQERTDRMRRDRAAAPAVRVAFPAVRQLRFELHFEGETGNTPASQSHVLHPPAQAFFEFPCPYADCNGQFDLTNAVNIAMQNASRETRGTIQCGGIRSRQHASKQPCQLHLRYVVTATCQRDT
jgi:hypothetical protein